MSGPLIAEFRDPETLASRFGAGEGRPVIARSMPSRPIRSKALRRNWACGHRGFVSRCWLGA